MKRKLCTVLVFIIITVTCLSSCRYQSRMMHGILREMGFSDEELDEIDRQYEEEYDAAMNQLKEEIKSVIKENDSAGKLLENPANVSSDNDTGAPGSDDAYKNEVGYRADQFRGIFGSILGEISERDTDSYIDEEKNIVILGKDIGYKTCEFFSTTGEKCVCHGRKSCGEASDCTCIIVNGTCQCFGFAMWCQKQIFGYNEISDASKFEILPEFSRSQMHNDGSGLKEYLYGVAKPGSHIRTGGSKHSMIIMSIDENGFRIAQANGQMNEEYTGLVNCKIGTKYYTWEEYATTTYGKRGISYVSVPKEVLEGVVDKPVDNQSVQDFEEVIVEGWAEFDGKLPDVYCIINNDEDHIIGPGTPYERVDGKKGFQIKIPFKYIEEGRNSYIVYALDGKGEYKILKEGYIEHERMTNMRESFLKRIFSKETQD